MTLPNTSEPEDPKKAKLPRQDWILLPVLSLLTISFLMASTEMISRRMFPTFGETLANCLVLNDQSTGVRGRPNTTCMYKRAEHSNVEYKFNNCGHRAGMECEPKPGGTYRIVLMGASYPMGLGVPIEDSFASLLPDELSRQTGRKVEVYNEGMWGGAPHRAVLNFNEVLAAKPDLILWPLTPWDLENVSGLGTADPTPLDAAGMGTSFRSKLFFSAATALKQWKGKFSATHFLIQHFLYESPSLFVRCYLFGGDDQSGFLRSEPSANWQSRLRQFESYLADAEGRASAAGVPLVVVQVPDRVQAAMISMGEWPAGYDPYKLSDELRAIVTEHGATYIDVLPDYRNLRNPEQGYFPVDDHPNAVGHAVMSRMLAKELTSGAVPALRPAM